MPFSNCRCCNRPFQWAWDEAFDKFGFGDGDGTVQTAVVASVLEDAGYEVTHAGWGLHNDVIESIMLKGVEQIPTSACVGYDDPRRYLPEAIVKLLDHRLGADVELMS